MKKALILFHEKILDVTSEEIKRLELIGRPHG